MKEPQQYKILKRTVKHEVVKTKDGSYIKVFSTIEYSRNEKVKTIQNSK